MARRQRGRQEAGWVRRATGGGGGASRVSSPRDRTTHTHTTTFEITHDGGGRGGPPVTLRVSDVRVCPVLVYFDGHPYNNCIIPIVISKLFLYFFSKRQVKNVLVDFQTLRGFFFFYATFSSFMRRTTTTRALYSRHFVLKSANQTQPLHS